MAPIRPCTAGRSGEAGFTLTELLVVLAIIGLLITATPLLLQSAIPQMKSLAAARLFAGDLRAARGRAVSRGASVQVHIDAVRQRYLIDDAPHALPDGVRFATRSSDIAFLPDGSSSGGSVLIEDGMAQHKVRTEWLTGRVSIDE